jgi:hypothetical protein
MKQHSKPTPDVWPSAQSMEQPMSSRFLTAVIVVSAVVLGGAIANADPLASPVTTEPQAPIGHLQPRAHQISPGAPAEQMEQQRLSTFDAEQQKLDQQLDKSLNICRC